MLQNFYEGLTPMSKGHVDAAAGGAFFSLTIENAMTLIEKMVANQSRGEGRKTQRHAYREGDISPCRKNRPTNEEIGQTGH